MAQTPNTAPIFNLTEEQIQANIVATKNRLNAVQGQANGMVSEAVNNEINGYGSIIIQLLQRITQLQKSLDTATKQLADAKPNLKKPTETKPKSK